MKIFIDPGHGGSSIGATYKGRKEQDDCLKLSLKVRDYLLKQKNCEVKLSRTGNTNPSISQRCSDANTWGADYFISIHRNAIAPNKATGAEIWVYSKCAKNGDTYKMAEKVLNSLCSATGYKNRGVKLGAASYVDYGVNSGTKMSSCLAEVGFVDNDSDNAIFDKKFNEMAEGIARGIYEANGGKWAEIGTKTEEKAPAKNDGYIYTVQVAAFSNKANAEAYAEKVKKAGFDAFVTIKGDYDGDGKITSADARQIMRDAVGLD